MLRPPAALPFMFSLLLIVQPDLVAGLTQVLSGGGANGGRSAGAGRPRATAVHAIQRPAAPAPPPSQQYMAVAQMPPDCHLQHHPAGG